MDFGDDEDEVAVPVERLNQLMVSTTSPKTAVPTSNPLDDLFGLFDHPPAAQGPAVPAVGSGAGQVDLFDGLL